MKFKILTLLLFSSICAFSQSLPIDFESNVMTSNFIDFDGGLATVIPNPQSIGINESGMVAHIVRDGGAIWAGSKIELQSNLDFSTANLISMKVFTTAPAGTQVKFKLESATGSTERDVNTTTSNEWETLTWDFTGTPTDFNSVVFMFDFGNVGDGSENSTFLFDDIQQEFGGEQINLPVDFEDMTTNYTMTDFGGNVSSLITDPEDAENQVMQVIKTDQAATWAGTTIGTSAGFANNLPLQITDSKMTVRVWSPDANTPIRLKVENSSDPTQTCETETKTTTSQEWETIVLDFNNEAPGTQSLEVGLSMGWTYNKASIFFNFDTEGATAGEKTYFFDDVMFGDLVNSVDIATLSNINVYPNPTTDFWQITSADTEVISIQIMNLQGGLIYSSYSNSTMKSIDASSFARGIYLCKINTSAGSAIKRIAKN